MVKRIPETELILPSLFLMSLNKNGAITTSELIRKLRDLMRPSGEDLEILASRNDDKFSQKVRNLTSHDTFKRDDLARYVDGHIEITENGRAYLRENQYLLEYLLANDFAYPDIADSLRKIEHNNGIKTIEVFDENVIIQEGQKKLVERAVYERSSALRDYAIRHFTKGGRISCKCCDFDFQEFYGDTGSGFIEIHHTKPIFKYEDEDLETTLRQAMDNLTPVCSNCHRMIHRSRKKPLEIQELIDKINVRHLKGNNAII